MSRTGKLPVNIQDGVTASVQGNIVEIKGPKGTVKKEFDDAAAIKLEDNTITVSPADESRFARAMYGTARSIIAGMVEGVRKGFSKDLEIQGVGFRAAVSGNNLNLNLGYSHDINYKIPAQIKITITENTKIKVEGCDKQVVGQVAADIKSYYPIEPYKGKGVRIIGEFVRRKEGKKTA